jgi:1-acyl-sn-glycerol-3-phosphate acyltransferase
LAGDSTITSLRFLSVFAAIRSFFALLGGRDTLAPEPEDDARSGGCDGFGTGSLRSRQVPTPFYNFIAVLSWPVFHWAYRLRATGVENVPTGGAVLAANHTSNLDPWPLGFPLWPEQQLYFMGKSELFNPVLGPLLRAGGAFPVRRGQSDVQAIQTAVALCKSGKIVAMFPEGTRRQKGMRKKFTPRPHAGSARIALAADVPLVPAAIKGTDRMLSFPQLAVAYGPAIPVDDLEGLPPKDAVETSTQRLMAEIEALYDTL